MIRRLACIGVIVAVWGACENSTAPIDETPPPPLYYLKALTNNGDGQRDTVRATLALPFRVLVRRGDVPAPNIEVRWEIDGDTLTGVPTFTDTSRTDASGIATSRFRLRLGSRAGAYAVRARVEGVVVPGPIQFFTEVPCGSGLCFTATALPGRPRNLQYISGNGQVATFDSTLPADYVVMATDTYGNGAPGVVIDWAVTAGGGAIAPAQSTTTAPYGFASARHTLGAASDTQRVRATAPAVPGASAITFSATGFSSAPVASVTVTPESVSVQADRTARLSVVLRDANGRLVIQRQITWTSLDPAIATVDTAGLVRGSSPGETHVVAESEGVRDSAAVTVTAGPPPVIFASLTAGFDHTCGLKTDGSAYCWGSNESGQLGISSMTQSSTPVAVSGGLTFIRLVAGGEHTCGLTAAGAAYCWGRGDDGQLGNGVFANRSLPVPVSGNLTFSALGSGAYHTCGVTAVGAAYCWGWNWFGQLGNGETFTSSPAPRLVSGNLHFVSIAAGFGWHTCGIIDTGAGYCWGHNDNYAVGVGLPSTPTPQAVSGGILFTHIATGVFHSCALNNAAAVYCWGDNHWSQLGDGTGFPDVPDRPTPGPVTGGSNMSVLTAGGGHNCMVSVAGAASCWGRNEAGQIGDGSLTERSTPVPVSGGLTFAVLAGGGAHTCGLTTAGATYCWGSNASGQLGDGTTTGSPLPVRVVSGP